MQFIYVGLGGFFGAISRFLLTRWIDTRWETALPYGTMAVNALGSFLLGFLLTVFVEKGIAHPHIRIAVTTGFLGALTTFSTFSYETVLLFEGKNLFLAGMNVAGNLVFGLLFVTAGAFLARGL